MIEVPYCEKSKTSSKNFLKKFHKITNDLFEIKIKWITKKLRNLFRLKSKNPHLSGAICKGMCVYKENYMDETKRNVEIRWEEHSDIKRISEPSGHLKIIHTFTWKVLMTAPINDRVTKNLEASFMVLSRPSLNEQIDSKKLLQFRNGVTWQFYCFNL